MKIATKYILVNRNVYKVKDELEKLTENKKLDTQKEKFEIFYGEIKNFEFTFTVEYRYLSRVDTPVLLGEIIKKNENETIIKIDVIASVFHIIWNIFWIIFFSIFVYFKILMEFSKINLYTLFISILIIFLVPVISICVYMYYYKNMLEDIHLYCEGYYDKYL